MAPDLIRAVLLDETDNFEKGEIARRALGSTLGNSILIADGSRWCWQRRAVAGIFREQRIRDFLPAMIAGAEHTRDRWRALPKGTEIDIAHEMRRTTFEIILSTMLPERTSVDLEPMQRSISDYLEPTAWIVALAMLGVPSWVPYPGIYRARCARKELHRLLGSLIEEADLATGKR
jgi:cytochrome P450